MINSETLAVTCGLGSAVAWGAGDFSGGFASRKGNLMGVILFSQLLGGFLLTILAVLVSETVPEFYDLFFGLIAGLCGCTGLTVFYWGLTHGRMGIVAPLSAVLTAIVPIGYAAFFEGLPSLMQFAGFFLVLGAVWLLSAADNELRMTRMELGVALVAGLGFGLFFIFIDRANSHSVFWPLVAARVASVSLLCAVVVVGKKTSRPLHGQWLFIVLCAVMDAGGNALFSMAAHLGRLDVAAVLGSLYPASTVALAWFFLKERLGRQQWAGVALAFVALFFFS